MLSFIIHFSVPLQICLLKFINSASTEITNIEIIKMNERNDLKFEDFIKICRLCCKSSKNMSSIFHKTEDDTKSSTDDTGAERDTITAMLLKIGLSVTIELIVSIDESLI